MTITRIFWFAGALALATLIGTNVSSYAAQSCCKWVGDKYINLKTGKLVKPPKGTVAPLEEGVTEAKPKPAAPPDPYYRLPTGTMATPTHFAATMITMPCRLSVRVTAT
jgi:hypothetical protein